MTPLTPSPTAPPMALAQLSFMACRLPLLKNYILTLKADGEKNRKKRKKINSKVSHAVKICLKWQGGREGREYQRGSIWGML